MRNRIYKSSDDLRIDLIFDLIQSFRHLDTTSKIANFLEDLLTPTEVRNLSVRLRIAKLLLAGKTQREICTMLHTSLVTTNKVNNWLGKKGNGFREVIEKLPLKWAKPIKAPKGPIEFHLPELVAAASEVAISGYQEKAPKKLIKSVQGK